MTNYIKRAKEMGYGVVVANPNENIKEHDPDDEPVFYKNSETLAVAFLISRLFSK